MQIYFEEDDFDKFAEKLKKLNGEYVQPIKEHKWGQRAVLFYDPDKRHIRYRAFLLHYCSIPLVSFIPYAQLDKSATKFLR